MLDNSRLDTLLETLMTRYMIGCFCPGDQVKFASDFTKDPIFSKLAQEEQDLIKDIIEQEEDGDIIVRVIGIEGGTATKQRASSPIPQVIELGVDMGCGLYKPRFAIPGDMVSKLIRVPGYNENKPPNMVPDNKKITDENTGEPKELTKLPKSNLVPERPTLK